MTTTQKNTRSKSPKKPADHKIAINADRDVIDVNLVGKKYEVKPPKAFVMLKMSQQLQTAQEDPALMIEVLESFIDSSFAKADATKIKKRLEDNNDDLDLPHIMEFMEKVMEFATGNPTT